MGIRGWTGKSVGRAGAQESYRLSPALLMGKLSQQVLAAAWWLYFFCLLLPLRGNLRAICR